MKHFRKFAFAALTVAACSASAGSFTPVVAVGAGLANPTTMAMVPDGRILIGQQAGAVKVVKNGALLPTNALTLTVDGPGATYTERGLLGITTDPAFATNGFVYIFYTTTVGGAHNKVSRFKMTGDIIDPASETLVVNLDPVDQVFHNGGALHFDLAGKLLIGTGENTVRAYSQSLTTTHGKILRLNTDGTIPTDNPFANDANATTKKIYKYGLRNPYTIDVQPVTGRFYINDVGQDLMEEINDGTPTANRNFGWPNAEGNSTNAAYVNPAYTYGHGTAPANGCAITGGAFFNPIGTTTYPATYIGKYFYLDLCAKWLDVIDPAAATKTPTRVIPALTGTGQPVGLDVAADGNLYYLMRSPDALYKITYTETTAPTIAQGPASQTIATSQPVTFSVTAAGGQPFTYQWRKNNVNIPGATNATYTIAAVAAGDAGSYSVVVTNSFGSVTSAAATLTVSATNTPPVVAFTAAPANNSLFVGGQVYNLAADANDAQEGNMPAAKFSWKVDLYHNVHVHDSVPVVGSKTFSTTIPKQGEIDTDIWYRISVTVTDAGGLTSTAFVDLKPTLKNITLNTLPAGLSVKLDGVPTVTPKTVPSVVGVERLLEVVTPQTSGGKTYTFTSWSNGGAASQVYTTANQDTTFTATYTQAVPTVSISSPINNSIFTTPATIPINVSAADPTSTISKIDFYNGATLTGTDTTAPYSYTWTGAAAGTYTISARSTNAANVVTTSTAVNVTVSANTPPTVSLTAPANNAAYTAPASITINANAADANGTVSKVEFYNGAILIGTDTAAPYSFAWANVAAGTYTITAKATDNLNAATTSAAVAVTVNGTANTPPTVSLTAPANNAAYTAPASIVINANAADANGTVSKVDFYNGATLVGTDTAAPYSFAWANVAAGTYSITARATDNLNAVTTSAAVAITVTGTANTPPTVSLTAPANNAAYTAPASITINANAADANGTVSKVEFYNGATLIGTDTAAPYSFAWANVAAGTYSITARATDNLNAVTTSAAVSVTVTGTANTLPTVSLTAPANNATYAAPASVVISANAADANGTVSKVEFYNGATLIGTDTAAPYSFTWGNVAAGTYSITAKATDNLNAATTSKAASITVTGATGQTCVTPSLVSTGWVLVNDWRDQTNGSVLSNETVALKASHRQNGSTNFWLVSTAKYAFTAGRTHTVSYDINDSLALTSTEVGIASAYTTAAPTLAQPSVLAPAGYTLNAYNAKSLSIVPTATGTYNIAFKVTLTAQPQVVNTHLLRNLKYCY